jgi:tetratricopeptide (TPR) repeat protein
MTAIALVLLLQTDFTALYQQAYEERLRTLGGKHVKTLESARDLALYLAHRNEFDRAAPWLERVLEAPPANHPSAGTALHNWAVALEQQSPQQAEQLYRLALAIRSRILPPLDAELALTRLNLAGMLVGNNSKEAMSLAKAALAAFEKTMGASHSYTGAACGTLAAALGTSGDVDGAERLFRRAITIAEKAHGPQSAETAAALENLADLLSQTGREPEAGRLRARAQAILRGKR